MRRPQIYMFLLASLLLSGCETFEQIKKKMPDMSLAAPVSQQDAGAAGLNGAAGADCPLVKGLPELSSITHFADPKSPLADKMIASAKLENLSASCQVAANSVVVEIGLNFVGTLGPVGVKDLNGQANYTYPYFLSVITPTGQILSKDVFALSMVYDNGGISVRKEDKLRQVIPLGDGQNANQFQIVIGFQLSEDELVYNRSQKQ